jgi:glycosyltransferase 2 family protein
MAKKQVEKPKLTKKLRRPEVQLVLAVALFWASVIMVRDGTMAGWEKWLFKAIYDLPEFFTPFFLAITQLGGIMMLFALSLLCLVIKHYSVVIRLLMSGLLAYLAAGVAKDLYGRGRPHEFFTDLVYRDQLIRGPGFPSGHMAMATAIGLVFWHVLPKKHKWIGPAIIVGVGVSRVFLGVHAPIDILGGFALGWASVAVFRFVRLSDIRRKERA